MNQQPQGNPYNRNNQPYGGTPQQYGQQPMQGQPSPNYGMPSGAQGQIPNPRQIPNAPQQPPQPDQKGKKGTKSSAKTNKGKKKQSMVGWVLLGILLMFGVVFLGAVFGYNSAISARQSEYNRKSKMAAAEQYTLAISDIEQGNYANAKTRLDYVISIDRNYPGAQQTYQEVIIALYPTASPTPMMTATPAPTATPDTRGEEEMFQSIQTAMYSQQWESALDQMDALRDKNLEYRGLEVDGMYYIALRNYGMQLINSGYLESGIYKITLAESFGPIDSNASSQRDAARSYLSGAGFWEINWTKAMEYYSTAASVSPNMMDQATRLTANQRYGEASFEVGNQYVQAEDYCGALPYYQQGLLVVANDNVAATATAVYNLCYPPEPTIDPNASLIDDSDGEVYEEYYEENTTIDDGDFYDSEESY